MESQYISPKKASEMLGVHWMTLRNWEIKGQIECIRTPGGKRMYNVNKYLTTNGTPQNIQIETHNIDKKIYVIVE